MLITAYKNEMTVHSYINVKDIKRYYIENSDEKKLYNLKAETYEKEVYYISWYISFNEYNYIMYRIGKAIKDNENIIEIFDFEKTFDNSTFYNYCNEKISELDKSIQDKCFNFLAECSSAAEKDNLIFCMKINTLDDKEIVGVFNKLRECYEKEISLLDKYLAKCLRF